MLLSWTPLTEFNDYDNTLEGFISPEILVNCDSNLTQTQMLTLKLSPNRTLTQTVTYTLILTPKKVRMNVLIFVLFSLTWKFSK